MKNVFLTVMLLASVALAANRVDVWLESSVDVQRVVLIARPDGGCAVMAVARITRADGGSVEEQNVTPVDVAGANRATCLDILDNRAPALFKAERGF